MLTKRRALAGACELRARFAIGGRVTAGPTERGAGTRLLAVATDAPESGSKRRTATFRGATWSMLPQALATVVAEVRSGRREVVECGSGVSTVVLARALREVGGRLYSLEHDLAWAERTRSLLDDEGLDRFARVVDAPLRPHPTGHRRQLLVRGRGARRPARGGRRPAAGRRSPRRSSRTSPRSRYPALPRPRRSTRPGRPGRPRRHRPARARPRCSTAWERETDFRFQRRPEERIALGSRPYASALGDLARTAELNVGTAVPSTDQHQR